MLEIINEFFSKDSKIRNITIDELLKEYEIEEMIFWNYVYDRNLTIVAKIKQENKKRQKNKDSIEIYRLTKEGNYTFGDIARKKNITIEQVVALLQNEYLKGIVNYSFDSINERNTELLRQKKEFELYFYFIEHAVTFEQLANQFQLEEAQIIYYFDSILDSELTSKQTKHVFALNKDRERKIRDYQNKQKLCSLFILTEEEIQSIDNLISEYEKVSCKGYQNRIESLLYIKRCLSSDDSSVNEYCQKLGIDINETKKRTQYLWIQKTVMPTIQTKLAICGLIEAKRIYMCSDEKFSKIEYYMKLYAEYLNNSDFSIQDMKQKYRVNLTHGEVIDNKLDTTIFLGISNIVKEHFTCKKISNMENKLYEYYQNHFILFRDLGPIFDIEQDKLEQYYQQEKPLEWSQFCRIDEQRRNKILGNISILSHFFKLLNSFQVNRSKDYTTFQIPDNLNTLIKTNNLCDKLQSRTVYAEKLIRASQFICLYLYQSYYDTCELERLFNISNPTCKRYLCNKMISMFPIDFEISQYISEKRKIALLLAGRKGMQQYINHDSYSNKKRDAKGQFIKKYQPPIENE